MFIPGVLRINPSNTTDFILHFIVGWGERSPSCDPDFSLLWPGHKTLPLHRQTRLVSWSHHSLLICRYFKHPPDPLAICSAWFLQSTQLISWFLVALLLQKFLISPEHLPLPRRSSTYWDLPPALQSKKSSFRVREDSCLQKANCLSLKPIANSAELAWVATPLHSQEWAFDLLRRSE